MWSWLKRLFGLGRPRQAPERARYGERAGQPTLAVEGPRAELAKIPVALTVGLDFGTSTVKCIVQAAVGERRRRERHVLSIHGEKLFPSLAWEWDGALTIGEQPHPEARCYRSVKVCLRCPILKSEPCRRCFEGTTLRAEIVSWAILSYCLQSIRNEMQKIYPEENYSINWDRNVEWNMGVPLDGLDQKPLLDLFRDLFWRAVHFGGQVGQTTPCGVLISRYERLSDEHCPTQKRSDCFVLPEADVAVNAFLESQRNIEDGLYFICDVGAGTTDVSFFRFAQNADRPIIFYGTSSTRVGVDDFAAVIAQHLCAQKPQLSSEQALSAAHRFILEGLRILRPEFRRYGGRYAAFDCVYSTMTDAFRRAFSRAYAKEHAWDHWRGLRGALIGGGRNLPGVASVVEQDLTYGNPHETIRPEMVTLRIAPIPEATDLHGIAYGLSIPMAEYELHWPPDAVPEMERDHTPFHDTNRYVDFHDDW